LELEVGIVGDLNTEFTEGTEKRGQALRVSALGEQEIG
jgi:hypothetical protein